jgi:hypothetical protein
MKTGFRFLPLLPLTILIGCSAPSTHSIPALPVWQNWQIQAGTSITSPPNTNPSFVGAIQIEAAQASGIFSTVNFTGSSAGLDYTGPFSASTADLSLVTQGFEFAFTQPSTPYTPTPVGVTGGCIYPPGYSGPECTAIFASPSTGVEIAPLKGTYTGTLTDTANPSMSGTGTLILTQSTTPNSSGAFPLSGTITFPTGSDLGTSTLAGTISGEGTALSLCPNSVVGPCLSLTGSANPAATQITIANLAYYRGGTTTTFTGTLTLQ